MLRMRLQRRGKKNYATYRVVVAERGAPVKGRSVADVGHYNPHTDVFVVTKETVEGWLAKGVKPSSTVHNLLVEHKIITADKVTSWKPKKKEAAEGEKKPADTSAAAATPEQPKAS